MNEEAKDTRRLHGVVLLGTAVTAAAIVVLSCFAVDTSEYAVVTQFGEPVQVVESPGLRFKYPFQRVTKLDNRLFVFTPAASEFLTLEKTPVIASSAVLWRILDPKKYLQTVFDRVGAESRLNDIVFAELGAAIGRTGLSAFVSADPSAYRAPSILSAVAKQCDDIARRDYGIAIRDVLLQRLDYPERNRPSVFSRMKSERVRISMRYRSEGEEEGLKIRAAAEQEKTKILSQAFKVAQQHRGEGEAEAARIYADALSKAPDFYRFLRTMEAFRKLLDEETTLVLPSDSELFRLLYDSDHYNHDEHQETNQPTQEVVPEATVTRK